VPVTDIERAKAFYGETLGLNSFGRTRSRSASRCGDSSELSIFKRPPIATEHTLSHFEVNDIGAVVRALEAKDVAFIDYAEGPLMTAGHIAQLGPARAAWFHDLDGNTLGLRQG